MASENISVSNDDLSKPASRFNPSSITKHLASILILLWVIYIVKIFIEQNIGLKFVFKSLFLEYNWDFSGFDYLGFFFSIIMCVSLWFLGRCWIYAFDIYVTKYEEAALTFLLGVGIMGIAAELIAIAHLLYQVIVILAYLILAIAGIIISRKRLIRIYEIDPKVSSPNLYRTARMKFYRKEYENAQIIPEGILSKIIFYISLLLVGIITFLTFFHAIFFPITYWDSLILYAGYARMIFLEHTFPFKATAQVGIGLGANYPHLYPVLTASFAEVFMNWNDLFAQILPPLVMTFATVLLYGIILRITRNKTHAALVALLFRSIPYVIAYSQYASDYAFAMFFTVAFLYLAMMFIETKKNDYFFFAALVCAFSTHINYLMWLLWGALALMTVITYIRFPKITEAEVTNLILSSEGTSKEKELEKQSVKHDYDLEFTYNPKELTLFKFLFSKACIFTILFTLAIASTWYLRNYILTGNPVYAFFPNIFGGININIDVLKSAEKEWMSNGDGLWRVGSTTFEKLRGSWVYFVSERKLAWKVAPVFIGFCIPGAVLFVIVFIYKLLIGDFLAGVNKRVFIFDDVSKFYILSGSLLFMFLFYEYAIASMYLYQIIPMLIPACLFAGYMIHYIDRFPWNWISKLIIIFVGIIPGVAMGLMGFKYKGDANIGGKSYHQLELVAFRNPCMDKELFLELVYGDDIKMAKYINSNLKKTSILTHENRHLLYDPTIKFIHLDDWEIQKTYNMQTIEEKLTLFRKLGISYYLYVPNENNHAINKKVGLIYFEKIGDENVLSSDWVNKEKMTLIYKAGENRLYRFNF